MKLYTVLGFVMNGGQKSLEVKSSSAKKASESAYSMGVMLNSVTVVNNQTGKVKVFNLNK